MKVAYAGGHHFFIYPKGWVITFLVSTKGGHVFLRGVLLVSTAPPPVEIMNGPLSVKEAQISMCEKFMKAQEHERTDNFPLSQLSL